MKKNNHPERQKPVAKAKPSPLDEFIAELRPGQSLELLQALHILTREGKLNQDSRRKLKQITHLYQFIEKALLSLPEGPNGLSVADLGAGKSYLGFLIYDLFFKNKEQGQMIGIETRLELVEKSKQLVSQIINNLGSDRIGIIAYSGSAFPVLPITTDYSVAKMFLQGMNPGIISAQGTSIDQAITLATTFVDKKEKTNKLLIIISDGEDHAEGSVDAAAEAKKIGMKIITIGVGSEKGGPIPLKRNGVVESFQRDQNDEVVITKRNTEILREIAKATGGGYVDGNSTKGVLDYVKNALDNIQRTEFESTQMADFKSQFQWFLGFAFFLLFLDVFLLEKKTKWVEKMNLFNEKN